MISFFITNITNRNITIGDLQMSFKAYTTVNLLDFKHYHFTEQQIIDSFQSGSLYKKRKMFKIVNNLPKKDENKIVNTKVIRFTPPRSIIKVEDKNFKELNYNDQDYNSIMKEDD